VTLYARSDKQGIVVEGEREAVALVVEALQRALQSIKEDVAQGLLRRFSRK